MDMFPPGTGGVRCPCSVFVFCGGRESVPMTFELTNSSISTFMTCPEKYRLAYVERIKPEREADYFRIGGAIHKGMEIYGKTGSVESAQQVIVENYQNPPEYVTQDYDLLQKWMYEGITCLVLFTEWQRHWASQPEHHLDTMEVLATEECFEVPIRNPETGQATPRFVRRGKMDERLRIRDGRRMLKEYKTTSRDISPGSDYWWHKKIDPQPSGYYVACRELGYPIDGVLYDVIRKPTIRPSQVAELDADGLKQVVDSMGQRVMLKSGKGWKQSASEGERLLSRPMTNTEWADKLRKDIRLRPDWYFQRGEVTRIDSDLLEYEQNLWNQQKQLAAMQLAGRYYPNHQACISMGGSVCQYFRVCTQRLTVSADEVPEGFVRGEHAHEELDG